MPAAAGGACRLRRKLDRTEGTSVIRTVRTGGYIFTPMVEEA